MPLTVYPILLDIAGFRIHTYGVVVVIAVLAAVWLTRGEARRSGLAPDAIESLVLAAFVAGLLGARLMYVTVWEPDIVGQGPIAVLAAWRGGLALHGGLVAGFATGLWLCRRRHLPTWRVADALVPGLLVGQAIGRVACLMSGDAYGGPTRLPWAITFSDAHALAPLGVPLHPVQLYEAGLDLLLLALLLAFRPRVRGDGRLFIMYAVGYGVVRLVTEVFRGDRVEVGLQMSLLQAVSLALISAGIAALAWRRARTVAV